ncbi:MAG: carbamoyltransferase HypF [Smithellaceae bacterium]|nr:carbamoyltransferase HypF [Smithellaceae bacterium]
METGSVGVEAEKDEEPSGRRRFLLRGVVQGVGFRPHIWRLAHRYGLKGWVCNTAAGVIIEVEGPAVGEFSRELSSNIPPRARIESMEEICLPVAGFEDFEIIPSRVAEEGYQFISPDIATCPDCRDEIFNPADRRYRYPFTNCTNCGPRFTIIRDLPYDRHLTTMDRFVMCPRCQAEYDDPADRRFHAQPNACPECGPRLSLCDAKGKVLLAGDGLSEAANLLKSGKIIALKGLGGFLLAGNALDPEVVSTLRRRKNRPDKPLAVMLRDMEAVREHCPVTPAEETLLLSPEAPIVLLPWREDSRIIRNCAPAQRCLGVMLPYTPLHHLLMAETGLPLIMTSGNQSEEPIAKDNDEALARLSTIADAFLLHDREIHLQYDDSVAAVMAGAPALLRRARGYAPHPIRLPGPLRPTLASGAMLKNSFCLAQGRHAFLSQHLGDLENLETLAHYERVIGLYQDLFRLEPEIIAHDLHPEYLSTKHALALPGEKIGVQHHFAHISSCLAENCETGEAIGLAFDGLGYGLDGHYWGGEFVAGSSRSLVRLAHLEYVPMPGGEAAIRHPRRMALSYLATLLGEEAVHEGKLPGLSGIGELERQVVLKQIERGINAPLTSSCGRLFDAVSALLGLVGAVSYEGQAAIALEMIARPAGAGAYPFDLDEEGEVVIVRLRPLLRGILADINNQVAAPVIAGRFHNTLVELALVVCLKLQKSGGWKKVALSGGVFQNRLLLEGVYSSLRAAGFEVLIHRQAPCNDGGIALGQAVMAGGRA